jgi:hypothetical protein
MPAPLPLYHEVHDRIFTLTRPARLPRPSVARLALLITGLIAAQSCVVAQIAAELLALRLTGASEAESVARRLRRTLNDRHLTAATCYEPVLRATLDWPALLRGARHVVIALDESSKASHVHLVRCSLTDWGGALPLVWAVWRQNEPLPDGHSWTTLDVLLERLAALLPPGVEVVLVGDRAYGLPALIDRRRARGWHWVFRLQTNDSHRFRDRRGQEGAVRELVRRHLDRPGRRWKTAGWLFKGAGWRRVALVGVWAAGTKEPLVVLTDLGCRWEVLRTYGRRAWIEPGFRSDKAKGWRWEECQVRAVAHHERLLVAMAWATLLLLCLGLAEAQRRLAGRAARQARRSRPARPQPARESLFTMGLRTVRGWLYRTAEGPLPWRLAAPDGLSWTEQWRADQSHRFIFSTTVRS